MGNRDILSTSAEFQKVKYESLLEMDNKTSFGDCKVAPWVRVLAIQPEFNVRTHTMEGEK